MAGVSSTSSSPRLSHVPPIEESGAAGGVDGTGEEVEFGATLHVAPSHETIKSHLFQGWTLAKLNGKPPIVKALMEFRLGQAPQLQTEEARGEFIFKAGVRSNRLHGITYSAILDQSTLLIPSPLLMFGIYEPDPESSEVRAHERLMFDVLTRDVGMEVTAISSEELHLEREKIKLQFTAGIERKPAPVIIRPTVEEIAESHQKLISLLQAKSSEQKAERYDVICDLSKACEKGGSFPLICNASLLGKWDLIAINGTKPKDVVSYQWTGTEDGSLMLECLIAKGKVRISANGDVSIWEKRWKKSSSFETTTDSYQESRQNYRHRSSVSGWYQMNHFLFNPPVVSGGYADDRIWEVVSFSEDHLLFSDVFSNTMLLTRKKEESAATGGSDNFCFGSLRKSFYRKLFLKNSL